ncbi:probable ubiquitin-conjugating enzyme E2 23 isoform X1 [Hordeum vulgare subsp. vulgare]|uniref:probable ubiquitin-conjugating enzyme E2 23 isoform X1 n=1 Tax=Hordeum vulgare subsp. vulgare TaxID=112509 RepID=UPI000295B844|nr:probable ubiquitin-conjugating enzyme E2 23 isoform X1 [Hordeum vulgare subsp. vulgare]
MENLPNVSACIAEKNQENGTSDDAGEPEEVADVLVYREDIVSLKSNKDARGLVLEVAGEYDSEVSITDDESDGEENERKSAHKTENVGPDGDNANNASHGDDIDSQSSLPDNKVRVLWIDGTEMTEDIDSVVVVDRTFLHGDMVASSSDPTGQMGLVADVSLVVDLQGAHGEMIKGVSAKDLRRIREFNVGDYVVSGLWLGRVDEVFDNVSVLFDDGSVCKVSRADPMRLRLASGPMHPDTACPFYPGQRVKAVSSSVYKTSRWLHGMWKASRLEATVTKVETAAVIVYWIASAHCGTNQDSVPPEEQNPKDLTLLSCFSYASWQLADWCHPQLHTSSCANDALMECSKMKELNSEQADVPESAVDVQAEQAQNTRTDVNPLEKHGDSLADRSNMSDGDNTCVAKDSESGTSVSTVPKEGVHDHASYRKKLRKVFVKKDKRAKRRDESFERALLIANTYTKVDVLWQDGRKECGVSSTSLIPIQTPNDHEFFPEQYAVEKVSDDVDQPSETRRVGLVRSVNAKDRTVSVSWFRSSLHSQEPRVIECTEVVSAYELDGHPDYDYCYGDVVVRLPSVSHPMESSNGGNTMELDKNVDSAEASAASNAVPADVAAEEQLSQKESSSEVTHLSWVGNIVGFQDGEIEVTWGDGSVSKVGPHEIYVVGREDDGGSLDDGAPSDAGSWETVDDNEMDLPDDPANDDPQNMVENNIQKENASFNSQDESSVGSGPLSVALGFVTRLASEIFARGKKHLDGSNSDAMDEVESQQSNEVSESGDDIDKNEDENRMEASECTTVTTNDSSAEKSVDVVMADEAADSDCLKHFDVLQCPPDHHYLENIAHGTGGRKWVKKVQQEWGILEKNLPDYIYVRVFEDRMDLMRAVIIGASGTPYQDGLFFFDFYLPPEFPQAPPSAYYHSGGLRVNPNLYVDGKVCLSLLNTWTGRGNEVWDPSSSSILQVLVSLQGLVLNEKPYFNEAGYEKQVGTVEGEKNALPYNENTYLLSVKSMLYILRRPPMNFEDFVKSHFCKRGHYILKACEAYLQGAVVGTLNDDACPTDSNKEYSCSMGFKLALGKILPRLITALKDIGADCSQYEHLGKTEAAQES